MSAAGATNTALAELLCRSAEDPGRTDQQRRALRRAGRAALCWPVEASALGDERLLELRGVGPWLRRILAGWLREPPPPEEPPPIRKGFASLIDVQRTLAATPLRARGDLQTHTTGSDGAASVREMAEAAAARGLEYLAITDHSQGLAIAHGMDEEQLARQGEEIRAANEELAPRGFRILRAVEMNLSPDGTGDLEHAFLRGLDLVLGAFHSRLRVQEDQTERYLAALDHPCLHVLAHPRGRIFNHRLGLRADWGRVFERARVRGVAVEIDGYPDRQDLDVELLRLAGETGVMISCGSDAHAPEQLAFLDFSVAAAQRAGVPAARILNCMSAAELVEWAAARPR